MADDNLKQLVRQGLTALKAGTRVAADATQEIQGSATSPELKQALQQGTDQSTEWAARIDRALEEAGGPVGEDDNPILEAHHQVSQRIRQAASDEMSRDLGIIAAGQLAIHYWIASFGTLRNYAEKLGLERTDREFRQCAEEAKQADEQHSQLAEQMLRQEEMA
ncbi:ferritin-like domain-containing protein [uncultured Sphingomonas sp.]|uniref:YciE/YciF ferroxidase family protein n=1 Tax=uncultured Sphingomonas sp. TaxID=158754 RepID=UPI0035CA55A3